MIQSLQSLRSAAQKFRNDDSGVVTVEFMFIFPVFFSIFLMTYEAGIISLRHVMLERGVDVTVREVRIGNMVDPTRDELRERICEEAGIIPDCENQLQVELIRRDLRDWDNGGDPIGTLQCIDRGDPGDQTIDFTNAGNNELMYIRACARIDPMLPTSALGTNTISLSASIAAGNDNNAAAGSYALVSTAAYVVEPYQSN